MSETGARVYGAILYVLGGLLPYIEDAQVTDIHCNSDGRVWVKRAGAMTAPGLVMSPIQREQVLNYVASHAGQFINYEHPSLQCALPALNLRFQGTLPPLSKGPTFDLRRFSDRVYCLDEYITAGIMTDAQAAILERVVANRQGLLIAGSTGSGKTTLVNTLLTLPCLQEERILIIEDTEEIRCTVPNSDSLFAKLHVTVKDALMASLRKGPTRIIVGEVRSGEMALSMLDAGNTGHPGWISTIHADSAVKALHKLDQYTQRVAQSSQCEFIASNVDYVVFIRTIGATRKIEEILHVTGFKDGAFLVEEATLP